MSDRSALVNNNAVVILEVLDQRARVVPSSLKDLHTLLNSSACIARVVWRVDAREEGDVDPEGFRGEFPSLADGFAQCIG